MADLIVLFGVYTKAGMFIYFTVSCFHERAFVSGLSIYLLRAWLLAERSRFLGLISTY